MVMPEYKAYIESINNFPINDCGVSALQGFRDSQISCILFEEIEEVPTSPYNVVVATIQTTNKYFERFGIPPKKSLNIPVCLQKYCKRWIVRTTMYYAINGGYKMPLFIKPDNLAKEFIGGVMTKESTFDAFSNVAPDTRVLLSEVIDIVSEYRCYVIKGKLEGVYWYHGDFTKFIDCDVVLDAIKDYTDAPDGYTIDFGLTSDGKTVLIECNDGWSIGNYGLDHSKYSKLLFTRWVQIMRDR